MIAISLWIGKEQGGDTFRPTVGGSTLAAVSFPQKTWEEIDWTDGQTYGQ